MNKLISHALIKVNNQYLVIKRTKIKRGKENMYPEYWDIPGGMVEDSELPVDAAFRETLEEVNLKIKVNDIIHEDSNYDKDKNIVFTRLVYSCELIDDINNLKLQEDEHSEYRLINDLSDLNNEKIVPYLYEILK